MKPLDGVPTARLRLRRWRDSDRPAFASMYADPDVMQHFPSTLTREASDALVDRIEAHFDQHGWGLWALEVRATGAFIGFTGLNPVPEDVPIDSDVEVGWRLARAAWGRGYATEAAEAAIEVALGTLGLPEIVAFTAVTNDRSIAVMRRLGMEPLGRFDHPQLPVGHRLRPHVVYRSLGPGGQRE